MNNEELKKKICEIIAPYVSARGENERIADALIAAGIGDVSEYKEKLKLHRVFVRKDGGDIKVLYGNNEVDEIVKERNEYKHRAEVAGRIAKRACDIVFSQEIDSEEWDEAIFNYKKEKGIREIGITPNILYDYLKEQAEKELERERKE